ncbi:hypothetical protein [Pseudomonas aeruginosa]|uniref:hypothetical protein n=1 Tax=Pseudomonas aeruginosa TaxID=287 RepID=UPI0021018779|nr:hypothetical protein [Pseudomonas aeruginosa]
MSASPSSRLHLQVTDFRAVARDVVLVELAAMDGTELPAFTPGAHLELHLGNGLIRHYSLLNDCRERLRYQLAIGLGDDSRGGARFIHRQLRTGDRLHAAAPRNHFMLRATVSSLAASASPRFSRWFAGARRRARTGAYCMRSANASAQPSSPN